MHRVSKLNAVLEVATAMSSSRNLETLLPLVMKEAARVVEADRCTLFILDRDTGELLSRIAQGARGEIRVPLGSGIAGTVAQSGLVINLKDAYSDPRFNRGFDLANDYRTKSVLAVPMRGAQGETTGVLQALNAADGAFDAEDEELLLALGAQAAVAIENAMLYEDISALFEGFVSASVVAIESRDPTTAGHSSRVASLTTCLAEATQHVSTGPYAGLKFSAEEYQELRYASLLHDFGKVGVREPVLVKANKLYPHELELLEMRFALARKDRELASFRRRLAAAQGGDARALEALETTRLHGELAELQSAWDFVVACNRPTVLAQGGFEKLQELSRLSFDAGNDVTRALLTPHEVSVLSIPRGSLSTDERREIESHVTHTYRFLSQIPWTKNLKRIPEIAYAHHEKLDGKGYPRAMASVTIPVQSKMMAISDIYDALTASDRPYKKAVPHEKALDILKMETDSGQLDKDLFRIFIEADVPRRALHGG